MLPTNLTTNEVKNSAGAEVEFLRIGTLDRSITFAQSGETPNAPHRLKISHLETGTGVNLRRRSVARIDKTVGGVSLVPRTISAYLVLDTPVGDLATQAEPTNVVAEILSLCASLGASTTILYDGTGNGAASLIAGTL